jgi:hypothetical protein
MARVEIAAFKDIVGAGFEIARQKGYFQPLEFSRIGSGRKDRCLGRFLCD